MTLLVGGGALWLTDSDQTAQVASPTPTPSGNPAPSAEAPTPTSAQSPEAGPREPGPSEAGPSEPGPSEAGPTEADPSALQTTEPEPEPSIEPFPASSTVCPVSFPAFGPYARSAKGTSSTSCEFAEQVRAAYGSQPERGSGVQIQAYSPVTELTYTMSCDGDGMVTCTGGRNAVVHLGQ